MRIYQQTYDVLKRAAVEAEAAMAWLGATGTPRSRMAGSVATALVLHGLVLWLLIVANPTALQYREHDTQPAMEAELYEFVPQEEQVEPVPVVRPREIVEQPEEVHPEPEPQTRPDPVPQPAPQRSERSAPQTVNRTVDAFDPVQKTEARRLDERAVANRTMVAPTVNDNPFANVKAKKKEDEGRVDAVRREALAAPGAGDLNLHETPMPSIPNIAPSGLASDTPGRSSGEGAPPAGGAAGGGGLKGGRSGVSQALLNHESCVALQQAGKPIPAGCNMTSLANMKRVGVGDPAGRAHYGPIVAKKEAYNEYKRSPGNADYWKRVNKVPSVQDQVDKGPATPGTYSNQKERRAKGECHLNNSC